MVFIKLLLIIDFRSADRKRRHPHNRSAFALLQNIH